ncbi:MAG TPA: dienelactone hydrolase family protein [Polyangiaceae bacterium]|jgi:phospholipase/carboxylesterase|nr:dienelactone hydrolase family protein [Polyangiaceae bacterium]
MTEVTGPFSRRTASYVLAAIAVTLTAFMRLCPRPASLPLETAVDGPAPAAAAGVLVLLHGRGGNIARSSELVKRLRQAGLPADVSVVLLEGPFPTNFGHAWGNDAAQQATSRARVRARLGELLGAHGPSPERVVLAGFSQGAGIAGDIVTEEPRIGALASFSPCGFWLRAQLPKRKSLRVLLAHGSRDDVCPVNESRSLATVLKGAQVPVQYLEFDGGHTVPAEVVRALVAFTIAAR